MTAERVATVRSGDVQLAVFEWTATGSSGSSQPADVPTVVLVHGYPDTHTVWTPLAEQLLSGPDLAEMAEMAAPPAEPREPHRLRVIGYDVRGAGASTAPRDRSGYHIERLVDDQLAVLQAIAPSSRVHLVAHDWGSIQSWHAVTGDRAGAAIASYTSISGPCLDHVAHWARGSLRSGSPRRWGQVADQLRRSWYAWWYQLPVLAPLAWRLGWDRVFTGALLKRDGGAKPTPPDTPSGEQWPAPSLAVDGRRGIDLYRANFLPRLLRPEERHTSIPVQLIVPSGDRYIVPALFDDLDRWADRVEQQVLPGRHWVIRSEPAKVAGWVRDFVQQVESSLD